MARRMRRSIKWEYKPGWNYVRERLLDPGACAKASYRTLSRTNVPTVPEGVLIVTCCPKGSSRNARGQCCSGTVCSSGKAQAIRHSVGRFRFRHPDVWAALKSAPPSASGIRIVWGAVRPVRRRRAA